MSQTEKSLKEEVIDLKDDLNVSYRNIDWYEKTRVILLSEVKRLKEQNRALHAQMNQLHQTNFFQSQMPRQN